MDEFEYYQILKFLGETNRNPLASHTVHHCKSIMIYIVLVLCRMELIVLLKNEVLFKPERDAEESLEDDEGPSWVEYNQVSGTKCWCQGFSGAENQSLFVCLSVSVFM